MAAAIEAAGADLPEDDGLNEMDDELEPSDGAEGYLQPASEAPDWHPWSFLPSERDDGPHLLRR